MKRKILLALALILLVCAACESGPITRPPSEVREALTGNEIAAQQAESTPDPSETPEPTSQVFVPGVMFTNGEISGYCMGEDLCAVYKYVPSTFDSEAKYLGGVIDTDGNFVVELSEENAEWFLKDNFHPLDGISEDIYHMGNNIFAAYVSRYNYMTIYDANTNTSHAIRNIGSENAENIFEGFSNGVVAVVRSNKETNDDQDVYIDLIFDDGTVKTTSTRWNGLHMFDPFIVGKYSDGLFFFDEKFYDIDFNCAIDCSQYDILYDYDSVPFFEDGKCHLEVRQNGKLWDVYIDLSGNIIGEPTEIIGQDS